MSKVQCYGCQKIGHYKIYFPNMDNNKKRKGKQITNIIVRNKM